MTPYKSLPAGARIDDATARDRIENVDVFADTRFFTEDRVIGGAFRAIKRGFKAVLTAYRRRALEAQLSDLDDYMLADIGLRREEIGAFVARRLDDDKA